MSYLRANLGGEKGCRDLGESCILYLQYEKSPCRTLMPAGGLFAFGNNIVHIHEGQIFLA